MKTKKRTKRAVVSKIRERARKSSVYQKWLDDSTNCFYCDVELTQDRKTKSGKILADTQLTADHFIPYEKTKEKIHLKNLVPCCYLCNQLKRSTDPIEYWIFAQFNIKPIRNDKEKLIELSKNERFSIIASVNREIKRNIKYFCN